MHYHAMRYTTPLGAWQFMSIRARMRNGACGRAIFFALRVGDKVPDPSDQRRASPVRRPDNRYRFTIAPSAAFPAAAHG